MRDCKIFWIAGAPRVGSIWTFNVTRELAGYRVLPEQALADKSRIPALGLEALNDQDPETRWVFKLHDLLNPEIDRSLFIVPHRDPRDAMMSAWRFLRMPTFETALEYAVRSLGTLEHYEKALFSDRKLALGYRLIAQDPGAAVRTLAAALEIDLSDAEIDAVVSKFDKRAVAQRVAALEAAADSAPRVGNADGSQRLFDPATGFQTGHVSDYCEGDWRRLLSAPQLAAVDARLGPWLQARGYPPTIVDGRSTEF
jgi:hypothetical protein